jgi:subtilisin family serine protease
MTLLDSPTSRRTVLRTVGLGTAGVLLPGAAGRARATVPGVPGRVVVGTDSTPVTRAIMRLAEYVFQVLDFGSIGQAVAARFPPAVLRVLADQPGVRYVEADAVVHAVGVAADTAQTLESATQQADDTALASVDWGARRVGADRAWTTRTAEGVHIAILDTGIDHDHPDLKPAMSRDSISFVTDDPFRWWSRRPRDYNDRNGHGTHVAGIAAGVGTDSGVVGVGRGATLHAVKVLTDDGWGLISDVAAGVRWVADRRANWGTAVANLSLTGPRTRTLRDACRYAARKGVLLVAAAGNNGGSLKKAAPATYDTVLAVSATRPDDRLANFSNRGRKLELAAPGVGIRSTFRGGGYRRMSGTSMACPHVSGGAALAWATLGTDATAEQVRTHLQATAEDLGRRGRDAKFGYGLLDAAAVVGGPVLAIPEFTVVSRVPNDGDVEVRMHWRTTGSTDVTLTLVSADRFIAESWGVGETGTRTFRKRGASPATLTAILVVSDGTSFESAIRTVTA